LDDGIAAREQRLWKPRLNMAIQARLIEIEPIQNVVSIKRPTAYHLPNIHSKATRNVIGLSLALRANL